MWASISRSAQACGPAPMFTWVDASSRIELSGTTFLNGVSKAANMLRDGLEIESGDSLYCDLGNHWQSPVWFAAAMSAQAVLQTSPQDALCVVSRSAVDDCVGASEIVVISRDPFGMPERDLDSSVVNGSLEVRGFGDHFSPMGAFDGDDTVLQLENGSLSKAELLAAANDLIVKHDISSSSRMAIELFADVKLRLLWQVVIPVVAGCSVVLIDGDIDVERVLANESVDRFISLATILDVKE